MQGISGAAWPEDPFHMPEMTELGSLGPLRGNDRGSGDGPYDGPTSVLEDPNSGKSKGSAASNASAPSYVFRSAKATPQGAGRSVQASAKSPRYASGE